jgi:L-ascorbate metabolism protein UlaG (beta-lactamase superfamily)
VTTPGAAKTLRRRGFRAAHPLQAWQSLDFVKEESRLAVIAMPATHGPMLVASLLPSVIGSLLEFRDRVGELRYRIYISGDTVLHDALKEIPRRYPNIDLALLHLGGARIFGVLLTMNARQGVAAINVVRPRRVIPIHYDDYPVFRSSLRDFQEEVQRAGLDVPIQYLNRGDEYIFEPGGAGRAIGAPAEAPLR